LRLRERLAFAPRKSREANARNIEFAQADISNSGAIARRFDRTGDVTDLDNWHTFESENPNTFLQMDQFEVRKN
jgi:hypothetical protein